MVYACSKCGMDLCDKCYWHRDLIHKSFCQGTEWQQIGPEFEKEGMGVEPPSKLGAVKDEEDDQDSDHSVSSDSDIDAE